MTNGENSSRYDDYSVPELICDPFFQDSIIHPDGESAVFWEDWLNRHPEKVEVIREARLLLQSLYFKEDIPAGDRVHQSLTTVRERIAGLPEIRRTGSIRRFWWAAAAMAGIVVSAALIYFAGGGRHRELSHATQYGELRTLYLPDSSKLILNAHSSVHYARKWQTGKAREVWLEGEGYFDVRSVPASAFLVHTKDLTVEVLGTAFDVRNRRGKTEVVLQSGKVRVRFAAGGHSDLVMAPGERIIFDPATAVLAHSVIAPEKYTSWKDKRLMDATVGEILQYLEDNYHKTFILEDETLANRKIGGVILLDNLDDALFALSTVLNVNFIQHQDSLIVRPR